MLSRAVSTTRVEMGRAPRMNATASRNPAHAEAGVGGRTGEGSRMAARPAITARKLTPFSRKHAPTPSAPISTPATAGPTTRAALKSEELSAIAFMRSSFPTSSTTNDWRVGMSKALTTPRKAASAITQPTVTVPVHDHAGVEREQQHAGRAERRDEPDVERGIRELENEPALGDGLHPRPREGHRLPEEEEPEVAVGERPEARVARRVVPHGSRCSARGPAPRRPEHSPERAPPCQRGPIGRAEAPRYGGDHLHGDDRETDEHSGPGGHLTGPHPLTPSPR